MDPARTLAEIRAEAPACLPLSGTNVWANDARLFETYRRRCRREAEEMTCAAQAAEVLAQRVAPGETLLDVGCAGGWYHWSFASRNVPVEYHGLDYTPECVALAREEMGGPGGLPADRFRPCAAEHLDRDYDTILCFNVLSHNPHFGRSLDVLLRHARKRILIRESAGETLEVRYLRDAYIDEGKRHLRTYFNTYPLEEMSALMAEAGFEVTRIRDRRTDDGTETVCGQPMKWRILMGERRA
jgi:cyclopropane fatty-acyl-phospholipid synthase-like methyltransferase